MFDYQDFSFNKDYFQIIHNKVSDVFLQRLNNTIKQFYSSIDMKTIPIMVAITLLSSGAIFAQTFYETLPVTVQNNVLWSADNEENDFSDWEDYGTEHYMSGGGIYTTGDAGDYNYSHSTTYKYSGSKGVGLTINNAFQSLNGDKAVRFMRWCDKPWDQDGQFFPDDAYYSVWMYFPYSYNANKYAPWDPGDGGWWDVFQFKSRNGEGSQPIVVLNVDHNDATGDMSFSLHHKTYPNFYSSNHTTTVYPQSTPIPVGQWIHIEAHFVRRTNNTGKVTVWQDGIQIFNIENIVTKLDSDPDADNSWATTNYTDHIIGGPVDGSSTIYIDDAIVATEAIYPYIPTTTPGLWRGNVSTDWNLAGNWDDNNIPIPTTNVLIPAGLTNYPVVGSTSQANCNNLTIDAGASLTLASDAAGTGSLIIDGTLTNNGTITSERYMPGANQAWHMVGSPVNNLSIAASSFNPGATDDFYAWDEPSPGTWVNFKNQDGSGGNPSFPMANGDNNFHAGKGYLVAYDATNPTKSFVGNLTSGNIPFTLSYHAVKTDWIYNSGWNLLSNPYPSGIDWNDAIRSNFQDNFAYIYDPNKGGGEGYTTVNGSNPDAYIAPHQGFLVVADPGANGQVFNFTTSMKTHGGNYLKATDDNLLNLRLTSGNFYNETSLLLDAQSSFQRDRRDALKLFSFNPEIPQLYSFSSDQAQLSVNSIPYVDGTTTVNLGFLAAHQDTYQISLQTQTGNMNHIIYLEDKLTAQMHNLSTHSYTFGSDAGQIDDRFTLHFGVTGINPHESPTLNAYCVNATLYITGENGPANLEIFALSGKRIASEKVILNGLFSKKVDLSTGMYLVRVANNNMVKTAKIIIR